MLRDKVDSAREVTRRDSEDCGPNLKAETTAAWPALGSPASEAAT